MTGVNTLRWVNFIVDEGERATADVRHATARRLRHEGIFMGSGGASLMGHHHVSFDMEEVLLDYADFAALEDLDFDPRKDPP